MSIARAISARMNSLGCARSASRTIHTVVMDEHAVHCMTEDQLDTWWFSLPPEDKAYIFEASLSPEEESCRYCGCTENRACAGGCAWVDGNHTVCSAPACLAKYNAVTFVDLLASTRPAAHAGQGGTDASL